MPNFILRSARLLAALAVGCFIPFSYGASPSGQDMPVGDLPGWRQIFTDDFTGSVPVGSFPAAVSTKWTAYPDGWHDTSGNGTYSPSTVASIANGLLNMYIHTANGVHMVCAPEPILPGNTLNQLYGRYVARFRSDALHAYKTAWLLWPASEVWPRDGEIDFPEGDLDSTIGAFMHHQGGTSGGDQDAYSTTTTYTSWHTAVIEWKPDSVTFLLDGVQIGKSTSRIPNTPMRWVLQTETTLSGQVPSNTTAGNVQLDWVAIYAYCPTCTGPSTTLTANTTAAPITVDGNLNEAVWSLATTASKGVAGSPNNTISFGALWNSTYLYVGVKVLDSSLKNDSVNVWDDDSVEVYIDGNHNKGTTYDSFDRQFTKGYNDTGIGGNSNPTGVLHGWAAVTGGYTVEMAIPWSNIGITPTAGMTIGFDIGNNDDDDGGARDSQLVWAGTANNSQNTSGFGDLVLSSQVVGGIVNNAIYRLTPKLALTRSLDVSGQLAADGTQVQIWDWLNQNNQKWKLTDVGSGYYKLVPQHATTKALDVNGAASADGTKIQIWTDNSSTAQKWKILDMGGGYYKLQPQCAPASCLDLKASSTTNGTIVQLYTDNATDAQRWKLEKQ